MSDIKAGDLVVAVLPGRCCGDDGIGHIFTVLRVEHTADAICGHCGQRHGPVTLAVELVDDQAMRAFGWETWRLKRIDPEGELQDVLTEETA